MPWPIHWASLPPPARHPRRGRRRPVGRPNRLSPERNGRRFGIPPTSAAAAPGIPAGQRLGKTTITRLGGPPAMLPASDCQKRNGARTAARTVVNREARAEVTERAGAGDGEADGVAAAAAATTIARLRWAASRSRSIVAQANSGSVSPGNSIGLAMVVRNGRPAVPRSRGRVSRGRVSRGRGAEPATTSRAADGRPPMTILRHLTPTPSGINGCRASMTSRMKPTVTGGSTGKMTARTTNHGRESGAGGVAVAVAAGFGAAVMKPQPGIPTARLVPKTVTTNRCRRAMAVGVARGPNPRPEERTIGLLLAQGKQPRVRTRKPRAEPGAGDAGGAGIGPDPGLKSHEKPQLQNVGNPVAPVPGIPEGGGPVMPAAPLAAADGGTTSLRFQADMTRTTRASSFSASRRPFVTPPLVPVLLKTTTC
jgi:hypothetical protein